MELMSSGPLVLVQDDFVDPETCRELLRMAKVAHDVPAEQTLWSDETFDLPMWPEGHLASLEPLLARVDELCGSERREDEQPPCVRFIGPRRGAAAEPGQVPSRHLPAGLHVDTAGSPYRFLTAMLYLADVPQPSGDGATVFPLADSSNAPSGLVAQDEEQLVAGARASGEALLGTGKLHTISCNDERSRGHRDVLVNAAEHRCGLSIWPKVGRLLVFFTLAGDGAVDPLSWHAGARVQADAGPANGKWYLQLFKTVPPEHRGVGKLAEYVSSRRSRLQAGAVKRP